MTKKDLMLEFENITDQLLKVDLAGDTTQVIETVESLIEKRNAIIEKVDALGEDNTVAVEVLNRIMQKNLQAETLLEEVMLKIKDGLKDVIQEKSLSSKKKKAHRGYMNPGHQNDGYFIDKKK
jgi:hypothetical protein